MVASPRSLNLHNLLLNNPYRPARKRPPPPHRRRTSRAASFVAEQTDEFSDLLTEAMVRKLRRLFVHELEEERHHMRFAHPR